ncbi:MAG: hypothetical protein PHO37_10430 [Kiritimatiellae bacterium]|nr:hypothetical protein [Kiritimatiellia bacterium]
MNEVPQASSLNKMFSAIRMLELLHYHFYSNVSIIRPGAASSLKAEQQTLRGSRLLFTLQRVFLTGARP